MTVCAPENTKWTGDLARKSKITLGCTMVTLITINYRILLMGDGESGKVRGSPHSLSLNTPFHDIVRHSHDILTLVIDA